MQTYDAKLDALERLAAAIAKKLELPPLPPTIEHQPEGDWIAQNPWFRQPTPEQVAKLNAFCGSFVTLTDGPTP